MKKLTIFTPTYNRAYILPKLYQSLKNQSNNNYVWLIVDDGSDDNTRELICKWQNESIIDLNYYFVENGGKMKAHNYAVSICDTELFLCVDSDDEMSIDAVDTILRESYKIEHNSNLSGIIAYRYFTNGKQSNFPNNLDTSTLFDVYRSGFVGETSLVFKTDILRRFPFPEIEGEKFITEDYVYDQLDVKYKLYILRENIITGEFQSDGYSNNIVKIRRNNPKGFALYYNQKLKLKYDGKLDSISDYFTKLKLVSNYLAMCKIAKFNMFKSVYKCNSPIWAFCSIPLGYILYVRAK